MLLSAKILDQVADVNHFHVVPVQKWYMGDTVTVYLQLVDLSQRPWGDSYRGLPGGLRYVPAAGATLTAFLNLLDDSRKVTRALTQAFPTQDPSIWALAILPTDTLRGSPEVQLTLLEGVQQTTCTLPRGSIAIYDIGDIYETVVPTNTVA